MKTAIAFSSLLAAAGLAVVGAQQQYPDRPGIPTTARVFIENRGQSDAVPVSLEDVNIDARPLRVEVVGTAQVALVASAVTPPAFARSRQQWEHRAVTVPSGGNVDATLASAGAEGWEAVGFQVTSQGASIVLLKRPR
jgi:hypothetical protein